MTEQDEHGGESGFSGAQLAGELIAGQAETAAPENIEADISALLERNLDSKYEREIADVRSKKLAWVDSSAFAGRLLARGAQPDDVVQIQAWIRSNLEHGQVHILSPEDLALLRSHADTYSKTQGAPSAGVEHGQGFHVSGAAEHLPASMRDNVYIAESEFEPKTYPVGASTKGIISHEMGHQGEDGVLRSGLYEDWSPRFKESAPDPEYIGLIHETDVRIRSMFNLLESQFDPSEGPFEARHLEIVKELAKQGVVERDVAELLATYEDDFILEAANYLPAI